MRSVLHDRLRVLAIGIRPTFAAACGVGQRGVVDILDAHGITGWQVGLRQLLFEAEAGVPIQHQLLPWMRAELRADRERWRHLASYGAVLTLAASYHVPAEDLRSRFLSGWRRNLTYALEELECARLVVSPDTVGLIAEARAVLGRTVGDRDLVDLLARLETEALVHVQSHAVDPPDLVLREFLPVLRAALATPA